MSFVRGHRLPPPRAIDRRVRVLNVRFLVLSAASFFVLFLTLRKWHDYQVTRHADTLLLSIDEAKDPSSWEETKLRLGRYLKLRPDDWDAMERYAEAEARSVTRAARAKAIQTYVNLLRLDPTRRSCWMPIAQLQLSIGMPKEALGAVSQFLEFFPADPDALSLRAAAIDQHHLQDANVPLQQVIDAYQLVFDDNPDDIRSASRLAYLLEMKAKTNETTSSAGSGGAPIMDQLVDHSKDKAQALFARYLFRRQFQSEKRSEQEKDLLDAQTLAPGDPEIQLAAIRDQLESIESGGPHAATDGQSSESVPLIEAKLKAIVQQFPTDPRPYYMLASLYELTGSRSKGIAILQESRKGLEENAPLLDARLVEMFLAEGDWDAAAIVLSRLEKLRTNSNFLENEDHMQDPQLLADKLWAAWYRADKNPKMDLDAAASHLLRLTKHRLPRQTLARISREIGDCYFSLGDWDLSTEAYQRAVTSDPTDPASWIGLAETYRRRGQVDLAMEPYRHVLSLVSNDGQEGPVRVAIAQLQLLRQLSTPSAQRRWGEFDEALILARRVIPTSPALLFLELQADLTRSSEITDDSAEVQQWVKSTLTEQEEFFGYDPDYWRSAFSWYWRIGDRTSALRALDNLEAAIGVKAFPERVRLAFAEGGYARAQPLIIEARDSMNPCQFSIFLTSIARDLQDHAEAMDWIEGLLVLDTDNLRLRGVLAELAAYASDMTELQKCDAELARLGGSLSSYALWSKIQLMLLQARIGDTKQIFWARAESRKLFAERPQWSLSIATLGSVAEMEGRIDEAISHFGDAFHSDHRDVRVLAKYVSLLALHQRSKEARTVLHSLPDSVRIMPEILPLSVQLEIEAKAPGEATRLARLAIANQPKSSPPRMLLGLALLAEGGSDDGSKAVECFHQATKVQPNNLTAWIGLLWCQLRSNHPERTADVLETLQGFTAMFRTGTDSIGPEDQDYLLARCVELDGNLRLANELFRRSIRRQSSHFQHPLPQGTIYSLELAPGPDLDIRELVTTISPAARQTFGLLLATEPDALAETAAQSFLDGDPRLSAIAAATRGGPEQLDRAITFLDGLSPGEVERGDCLVIADLLAQSGRGRDAVAELRKLRRMDPTSRELLLWAKLSLEHEAYADAADALENLEIFGPNQASAVRLKVQLLEAQNRHDDAVTTVLQAGLSPPQTADLLSGIGESSKGLASLDAAYQDNPSLGIAYATFLGRQSDTFDQAVHRLEESMPTVGLSDAAKCAAHLLANRMGSADDRQRLDEIIQSALAATPNAPDLCSTLAIARESEGDVPAALRLTKDALHDHPEDVANLNNLAWLLTNYQGESDSAALGPIRAALHRCGPQVEILDTYATAELAIGRHDNAIRLLEFCTRRSLDSAPTSLDLHLAEAYVAKGYRKQARMLVDSLHAARYLPTNPRDQSAIARLEQTLYTEAE